MPADLPARSRRRKRHERNEFTIENTEALKPGMEVNVTEGVLPSSYYYMIEHALGMSANFKQAERLKTRRGTVRN